MATKSKKFDRSIIIKTIAFIVALVCAAMAALSIYSLVTQAENRGLGNDIYNMVITGHITDITERRGFIAETENFIQYSLNKAAIYKGDSQKAYKSYIDEAKEKYIQNILQTVINESNTATPYYTFALLERGYISLNKIYEHTDTYYENAYYFLDGKGYTEDADFYFDANGTVFFEDITGNSIHANYDYDHYVGTKYAEKYNGILHRDIPSRILKEAGQADAVTEICGVYYGEDSIVNDRPYDGYYAVKINREVIDEENIGDLLKLEIRFDYYIDNYLDFSALVKENDDQLAKYKNMYFAFIDRDSGSVISTLPGTEKIGEENISISEMENKLNKKFKAYRNYGVVSSANGNREENFSNFGLVTANEFHTFYSENLTDKNVTYLICFDDDFRGGNDVFSDMDVDYIILYSIYSECFRTCLACLAVFLLCLLILIIKSGRRSYDDELHMMPLDRIFTDFRLIINAFLFILPLYIWDNFYYFYGLRDMWDFEVIAIAVYMTAVFIDLVLFISRHIKNHSLFKKVFIVWVITKIFEKIKKLRQESLNRPKEYKDFMRLVMKRLALFVVLPNIVLGTLDMIWFYDDGLFFIGLLIILCYDLIVLLKITKSAMYIRKIFDAIHSIRMGNNDIHINPFELPNYLRVYADDLSNVNEGLKNAVENAIKEQKTKTELITNVSHDLKTPLTSIITYTDLLSRCDIEDENARKYIDILCDKSERLKKLIEDLIEASKASSGTINVEIVKMSLNELVYQTFAEYESEFEKRNLTPIIELSEKEIYVNADSKLAFRTLDNLFGNVKKYAMPGTRVYIKTFTENAKAYVTIQNISESQLNISAEELMTRFVRGDESRNSDGNGLGLSIAESFSKLQNGELTIEINGDLFTAKVEYEISEN